MPPLRPGAAPLRPAPLRHLRERPEGAGEGSQLAWGRAGGGNSWAGGGQHGGLPGKHLARDFGRASLWKRVSRGFRQPPKWDLQGGMPTP